MNSLKQQTVTGIFWSAIDSFANQGIQFVIGIILARLISPREFGLLGMIAIFVAISQTLINSGFGSALIRKKDCSQADYSTVFFYNFALGILFYILLFAFSGSISNFYQEPALKNIIRLVGLSLIINSLTLIQTTILVKRVDFKLQAKISVISAIISGIFGIVLAYRGYGVYSLVIRTLSWYFVTSILLWLWNRWHPSLIFSKASFKQLFGFGSKILLSNLIDTAYKNVYYLIIGKFFSAQNLGYYTRADMFNNLVSQNINNIVSRVTYPVLAQMQDETEKLKAAYKKMIKSVMLINFILMIGMAAVAEPLIITLIGEKWRPSIAFLQLLCFAGMLYPLHSLNLNMLNVQGRSDLFLRLEIIKKTMAIPVIIIGIFLGIKMMILAMVINSFIAYYLNSYWSGRLIKYSMHEQISDIIPSFVIALLMGIIVFTWGKLIPLSYSMRLLTQILIGALFAITTLELSKLPEYLVLKKIILDKLK